MAKTTLRIQKLSYEKRMQGLAAQFRAEFGCDVLDLDDVFAWATATKRWQRKPPTPAQLFKRDMGRALRNQFYRDPQSREVRLMHALRGEQQTLWYDIRTAPAKAMHASLQNRRRGILADCRQCKVDFDSYNDNNKWGEKLGQMDFDFNVDLIELEKPTEYPDEKPEEPTD